MAVVSEKIEGSDKLIQRLLSLGVKLPAILKKVIDKNTLLLVTHLRQNYLRGGTTATKLKRRTGRLAASTRPVKATYKHPIVRGGVVFGTGYAGVHVGPRGQVTVIKPKNAKYLTIPLPAVQTRSGVTRGTALSGKFVNTFIARSKKGNLIIFGQGTYAKGQKTGEAKGKITPLFLLKKSVRVKARIHPEDILPWVRRRILADLRGVKKVDLFIK